MRSHVERVWLRPHKKTQAEAPGTLSAAAFQQWLGEARDMRRDGWDVTVLVALDNSHAVLLAAPTLWALEIEAA